MKLDSLDKLFSEYIRKRAMRDTGGCERCHAGKRNYKQLQCSHFHGRRKRSVRFDEDNACGICAACHMYLGANPAEHVRFFQERLSMTAFENLQIRAQFKHKIDESAVALYLREKLKELENGQGSR
jgi:hypothetical protein